MIILRDTIVIKASPEQIFEFPNFGTVFSLIIGINMLGGIIGPPLAGWVFDNWGSYQNIWFVFAGLAVAALFTVATTPAVNATVQPVDKD